MLLLRGVRTPGIGPVVVSMITVVSGVPVVSMMAVVVVPRRRGVVVGLVPVFPMIPVILVIA